MSADFYSLMRPESRDEDLEVPDKTDFYSLMRQEPTQKKPESPSFLDKLGQAFAFQMQSGGPAGAPSLSPEQAKKVATDVGTQAAVSGVFAPLKYLASLAPYAPRALSFITGLGEAATTGMAIPTAEALVEGRELPSKEELLKEGALWAGIDLAMQVAHLGTSFGATVNKLSKETGLTRRETIKRIWEGAKKYYGWGEPKVDPETGAKVIMPEQIEAMANLAEREPEILVGKAEKIEEPTISEIVSKEEIELRSKNIDIQDKDFKEYLQSEYPAAWIDINEPINKDYINIDDINLYEKDRGKGTGTKILKDIINYADKKGKSIKLVPSDLAGNVDKLITWYMKHGFVRDTSETAHPGLGFVPMIRHPKKQELTPQQIQNRKIAEVERKKALERSEQELQERKAQAQKESEVAFRTLGISQPKEAIKDLQEEGPLETSPDEVEGDELESEELSPEDSVRAKAFAETQLLQDKVSQKLAGMYGKINIEKPFQAVGAPETGRAVKLFHDTINAYLEEAKGLIKQLGQFNLTKDQLWDAFLAAENDAVLATPEMNMARDLFRNYFDRSFTKYQQAGGLTLPWPQSAINRLRQEQVDLKTKLTAANIKKQAQGRIQKEIENINKAIALLEKLKYIPKSASLITQALADVLGTIDPKYMQKFAVAAHKKRTTGALSDWIAKEPKIKELLHPYDFIGDYAYKKGKDLGLLGIVQNAINEGLASKGEKIGFKMDPFKFPALAGYNVHPALYEYITNLVNPVPFNAYDKISRWAKSSIVFDPLYAGVLIPYFRTLLQSPKFLARIPKYWKKALHDYLNKTPAYVEFVENGGASNPYPETGDFKSWLEKEKLDNGSLEQMVFNTILTKEGAHDLLNKMADFSWMIDRLARLAYYNMLQDKGFSSKDAAKLSAENFVDYSKLPAKTRRWLGRIFFAPATQVLSIMNDIALAASPYRLVKSFMKGKENFKNDRLNKERLGLLLGTILTLGGLSALYKMWGFKEEEFGTRYVSPEYEGDDGKLKESVLTPTHPLNYSLRWINTFLRGFGPGESSPIQKIWGRMLNQIGPVPSMITELGNNKDRNGKHIWDPVGDDAITASAKVLKYILGKIEPFSVEKFHTTEDKKAARSKIKEMMGWAEWFMDSIEFFYERKPESARRKGKINYLKREMKRLQKTGDLTESARERYLKQIEELTESPSTP